VPVRIDRLRRRTAIGDRYALGCALGLLLMSACTVGPEFTAPAPAAPKSYVDASSAAGGSGPVETPMAPRWWDLFQDPVLTALIDRAGMANFDVRIAAARLRESRAQLGIVSADGRPTLNYNASYTHQLLSKDGVISLFPDSNNASANGLGGRQGGIPTPTVIAPFDLWQQGFDASWELDLFGHVRREQEGARATAQAAEETRRDMLVSVSAEVARDYLQLRGAEVSLEVTRASERKAREAWDLTRERRAAGLASELDTATAEAQLATLSASLAPLEQQIDQAKGAIAYLLGVTRADVDSDLAKGAAIPPVPPAVPIGLPSELARRRPDIRAAEAQLHRATADIGVAQAEFYPRITLSGSAGLQALQLKNFGSWGARNFNVGPGLTLPLFEGGMLRSTLELRRAEQQEAGLTYERTVLQAFHEVDDALTAYAAEQRRRQQLAVAADASHRAALYALDQYRGGLTDFLRVLDADRTELTARQQLAASDTSIDTNLVQLYKALGGGWTP
jgi:NodT family efflux transporter outer membrane factor (OMF) lipoprotein